MKRPRRAVIEEPFRLEDRVLASKNVKQGSVTLRAFLDSEGVEEFWVSAQAHDGREETSIHVLESQARLAFDEAVEALTPEEYDFFDASALDDDELLVAHSEQRTAARRARTPAEREQAAEILAAVYDEMKVRAIGPFDSWTVATRSDKLDDESRKARVVASKDDGVTAGAHDAQEGKPNALLSAEDALERLAAEHGEDWVEGYLQGYASFDPHQAKKRREAASNESRCQTCGGKLVNYGRGWEHENAGDVDHAAQPDTTRQKDAAAQGETVWVIRGRHPEDVAGTGEEDDIVGSFDTQAEADAKRSELMSAGYTNLRVEPSFVATKRTASSPKALEWIQAAEAMLDDGFIPEEYFEMVQIATDEDNIAREPEVAELLRQLDDAAAEEGYLDFEDIPGYVDASKKTADIEKEDPEANLVDITDPDDTVDPDDDDIQDAEDDSYDATGSPIEETWVAFVTAVEELEVPSAAPTQLIYAGPDQEQAKFQLGIALRGTATSWQREGDIEEWEDALDKLEAASGEVTIEFGGTKWVIEKRENELATTASKLAVNYPRTGEKCPNCGAEDWEAAMVRDVACGMCGETFDVQGGELKTSKYNLASRKLQMIRDRKDAQLTVARLAQQKRAAPYFEEGKRYKIRHVPEAPQPELKVMEARGQGMGTSWGSRSIPLSEGDVVTYVGSRRTPGSGSVSVDFFRTADGEEGEFSPNSWGAANAAYFIPMGREPAPEPMDTLDWTEETGVWQATPDDTYDLYVESTDPTAVEADEFDFIEAFGEYDEEPYMWVILKDLETPVAGGWAGSAAQGKALAETAYRNLGTTASKTAGWRDDPISVEEAEMVIEELGLKEVKPGVWEGSDDDTAWYFSFVDEGDHVAWALLESPEHQLAPVDSGQASDLSSAVYEAQQSAWVLPDPGEEDEDDDEDDDEEFYASRKTAATWIDFDLGGSLLPSDDQYLDKARAKVEKIDPVLADIITVEVNRARGFGGGLKDADKVRDIAENYDLTPKEVRAMEGEALQALVKAVGKRASKTAANLRVRVENQGELPIGDPLRGWAGLDEEPWFWVVEHGTGPYPDIVATGTGVTEEAARAEAEIALAELEGDFLAEEGEAQAQLALGRKQASSFDPRSILTDIDRSEWREWGEAEDIPWQTLQKAVIEFVMERATNNIDAALRADVAVNDMAAQGGDAMDIQYEVSDLLEEEGIDRDDTWATLRDEWAEVLRGLRRGGKRAATTPMECHECGHKFKKSIGPSTTEVRCPKCGGYDTEPAFLANKHAGDAYKSEERFLDFCDALGLDERSREAREAWAEARQSDEKFQEVYRRYKQAKTDIMSLDAGELRDELARLHSSFIISDENKERIREVAQRLSDLTGIPYQQVVEIARDDAGVERGWGDQETPKNWKIPGIGQYERSRAAAWHEDPVNVERLAKHITSNYNTNNGQTIVELYREPHRFEAEWERMNKDA